MIKAKERPLESTSPLEKNGVAEPMKNVTVGECKPGKKKKNKVQKRWRMQVWKNSNASLEKKKNRVQKRWRMQVWKKKTKFKSPGKCYSWNPEKK